MDTFKYKKATGVTDDIPWIVETAFAWNPKGNKKRLITGVNWSPPRPGRAGGFSRRGCIIWQNPNHQRVWQLLPTRAST
jgi:hypothetical protein